MKIGFFELESWEIEPIKKAFPNDTLFFSKNKLTAGNADGYRDLEAISVFIYSAIDKKVLDKMLNLKLITTRSTGFDHIDVEECKKRKITVCNVPTYGENTVAEHTFALMLALSRKMIDCVERTKQGSFDLDGLRGFDLKGKTLGLIGCGNIGKHVVRIAKGLEMKVLVYDLFKDKNLAKEFGFKYADMDVLLKESDIITLHVPYNKHTHHLIDAKKLALMKKTAYIINTSRGGIIDTDALVKALQKKNIAGAGLDVLEEECDIMEEQQLVRKNFSGKCNLPILVENHLLLKMKNVIVTPHNAFNTNEALMRILNTTFDNIIGYKKGKKVNVC